ncbi:alpha-L-arabinofuranosidase C-terminal domain-containing protein [Halomontanus rarus]|uniref:alpha-L-arabinofuranosidase C-terminal domain-containing protein n=1 Tax=Halomontanus rarus TaxID=3034020 RepID=UPI001A992BD8
MPATDPPTLYRHEYRPPAESPAVTIDPNVTGETVNPSLYGKFTEHLGWNIYHGIDANTTFNPTFGRWGFREESPHPDGGFVGEAHNDDIRNRIDQYATRQEYPDSKPLRDAFESGLAFWWLPHGDEVTTTADTNPAGERAQRLETGGPGAGIKQWLYLPLQRTDGYEYTVEARSHRGARLTVAVHAIDDGGEPAETLASDSFDVGDEWTSVDGTLQLECNCEGEGYDPDALYAITLTADEPADLVIDRVLCYPDDHVNRVDPDVIEYYRDAELPFLRWPGGNFVSGYDWRDGIGPVAERPTNPNPAWDGIEPNLFGTAEFVAFCREVGAEPTICVNAGDGTPAEAAAWVEYCNGDTGTEMGALRAEHGYEDPFDVTYWEIGNELWGDWQERHTTPAGNADRYERFHDAIEAVDPDVKLQACGYRHIDEWNATLAETVPTEKLRSITTHPLAGGDVSRATDPEEIYDAFQGFPDQLRAVFDRFLETMDENGIADPKLAVTELQQFAHLLPEDEDDADPDDYRVGEETLPTPTTLSEALYLTGVVNHCIRMGSDVELLTHSAAVNHGGGLQKHKERVFPDPCYYAHRMGIALAGGTPLAVRVACDTFSTDIALGEIDPVDAAPIVDAMAVRQADALFVVLVVRPATASPEFVTLDVSALELADDVGTAATVTTLTGDAFYEENSVESPDNVAPSTQTVSVSEGSLDVPVESTSLVRVELPLS